MGYNRPPGIPANYDPSENDLGAYTSFLANKRNRSEGRKWNLHTPAVAKELRDFRIEIEDKYTRA